MSQQFYVIRKGDNDLEHAGHKYIKKKKVNGKWRYYYDIKDALGYDEQSAYKKATQDKDTATVRTGIAIYNRDSNFNIRKNNHGKLNTKDLADMQEYNNKINSALKNQSKAEKKYTVAKKNFQKTPLGFLKVTMPETISKGAKALNNLFKKQAKTKKKKK